MISGGTHLEATEKTLQVGWVEDLALIPCKINFCLELLPCVQGLQASAYIVLRHCVYRESL
jgi:hypothetical protein